MKREKHEPRLRKAAIKHLHALREELRFLDAATAKLARTPVKKK